MAFFDYESAGPGISKNAPRKKGIGLFFDILFRKFWQLMGVNLLYFLFFIPLLLILSVISFFNNEIVVLVLSAILLLTFMVTIGPATAGMAKIMRCYLIEKHTFIVRDFFRTFRKNFKKASIIGFIDCLVLFSVYASFSVYPVMAAQYDMKILYLPMTLTLSIALIVMMMNYYIYLMLIATSLSLKNLIKNSFALAFVAMKKNILTTLISFVCIGIMFVLMIYVFPLFLVILPIFPAAFMCYVASFNSYPVIQKYVINPYYTSIGEVNPELVKEEPGEDEAIFEDMGGKEKPIEKRKKGKGKRIS